MWIIKQKLRKQWKQSWKQYKFILIYYYSSLADKNLKLIDTVEKLNQYESDKKNYGNILRKKLGIFTE